MACPGALHLAGDNQKVGLIAREAVTMCEGGYQLFKLWPVGGRAGHLLAEYLLATGSRAGEVLRLRRDAGIAVNHAPILEQNLGTEKRNLINALGLFPKASGG
jgi:hypothetical protein